MWAEKLFSCLDGVAPGTRRSRIRAFQLILALVICTEYWTKALQTGGANEIEDYVGVIVASLLTLGVVSGKRRRLVFAGFALLQAWYVWFWFPLAGNHRYLELLFCGLFAWLD